MTPKPWLILTATGLDTAALPAPLRARKPWTYTVGDVFALPPDQCAAAFGVMAATPQHRYVVEAGPGAAGWFAWADRLPMNTAKWCMGDAEKLGAVIVSGSYAWPLPNVHLSTPECSTQAELDERAPWALRCPAAARVLRLVPTEGLRLGFALPHAFTPGDANYGWERQCGARAPDNMRCCGYRVEDHPRPDPVFDLVTLRGATAPLHPDWIRSVRDQCAAAGVAFRFDGWGEWACVYDRDKDDPDWRRCPRPENNDERYLNLAGGHGFHGDRVVFVRKVGMKASGRLIDGVTHDGEVPPC